MSPSSLGAGPAGDGRADDDVVLAAVAVEQHLEGGEQRHEERGALAPAERPASAVGELAGSVDATAAPPRPSRTGGPRPVGGQLERGAQRRRAAAPVGELRLEHLAREPAALPGGVVGVLDGQLGQRRRVARGGRPRRARASSRSRTPSDQPSETMWCIVRTSTCSRSPSREQPGAEQRARGQVEGPCASSPRAARASALALGLGQCGQVARSAAAGSSVGG